MPLTETENNILNLARKDSGAFSCVGGVNRLIELIDRLLAETDEIVCPYCGHGMADKTAWRESMNAHAIVAINVAHEVFLMLTLPKCPKWVAECDPDFDFLKEIEDHSPAGLYFVEFTGEFVCGGGNHVGICPGDCGELGFETVSPATMDDIIKYRGRD